jgi:polysaccharide biosynthesis transport protein
MTSHEDPRGPDRMADQSLHDYVNALRRRRWVVISSVLLAIGAASAVSLLQTPQYRAESQLLLRRTPSQEVLIGDAGQARSSSDSERELNNEIRLVESQAVRDAVDLVYDGPLDVDDVDGSAPESQTNDVLEVSLVSSDPAAATELVNVYVETYINERRSRSLDNLRAASDEIQARLDDLRARIDELSRPLSAIDAQIAAAPVNSARRAELEEQRQTISSQVQPQLTPLQSRESAFRGQLEQLEAAQNLSTPGGVEVLTPAEEPESPVSPNTVSNLVVGGLIGLLAGIALALMRDYLDDTVRSKDQAEDVTQVPTLGLIPKGLKGSPAIDLISVTEPTSPATEAYRSLRTSVKFLSLDASVKTILVTSAAASEGKTVTAANLAVVLAQRGDRVLLVGADFRRPRVHRLFGAPQSPGLTTVLLGDSSATSAVYVVEEVPGLHVMAPGSPPPNPAELLDSSRTRELLAVIADEYDSVIIDAPPVLPVTDAQILAGMADGVLLVVAYRETSRRDLARAIELLGQVEAPLVGTVLNLVPANEGYAGQSYRDDAYRSRSERRRRRHDDGDDAHPSVHPAGASGNGQTTTPVADRETSPLSPGEGARPDTPVPDHPRSATSKATRPKPPDAGVTGC